MKRALRNYQRSAFYYAGLVDHPALFLQMRLGKSLITIRRIMADLRDKNYYRVLIVAPYSALYSWERELRLEGIPDEEVIYLTGTRQERVEKLYGGYHRFFLINKEGHRSLPEIATFKWGWDAMVLDESTFIKAPPSKNWSRTKGIRENTSAFFCNNFRNVGRRFILTGTPAPESELDLFQQLKFLDPRILGFKNYYQFRARYFSPSGVGGFDFSITDEGREFLKERLGKYCFSLSRHDAGIDVRKVYERRVIALPHDARKVYDTAFRDFILEMNGKVIDATVYAMKRFVWMRRICGGGMVDDATSIINCLHREKVNELIDLLKGELQGEKVVIWAVFRAEIDMIATAIRQQNIRYVQVHGDTHPNKRPGIIKFFNECSSVQVFLGQPECFRHGVDLSSSDTTIFYSRPCSLETNAQIEDRVISIRKESVLYIDLQMENTCDEDIYESVMNKETASRMVQRMMRRS